MVILSLIDPVTENILKQWQFDQSRQIRLGRAPENQVVIDHPLVSRFHAEIIFTSCWQVINHGTNGILINNHTVDSAAINNGTIMQLAPAGPVIKFEQIHTNQVCQHLDHPPHQLFCSHCGQPVNIVKTVRDYQILKVLGQGGMGTTYLAWTGQKLLVLKEMNADMAHQIKAQELFEREAKILKTLQHSGIPQYQDFFWEAGQRYLAMELVHGQDLENYIYQHGPVTLAQALQWMIQLCQILTYIHRQQPPLIHRDIKPANLLVTNIDRQIFLIDFGAVKEMGSVGSTRIGAPDYMAPEQNQGKPVIQSDLYAIGPTIIFLTTGRNPGEFLQLTKDGYQFNLGNVPTITPKVAHLIQHVTAQRVIDRYPTALDLAQALAQLDPL
jgi:serine/threonine protein kinase, bacterial